MPFEYFLYDSSKLGQVRNFATSSQIRTVQIAINGLRQKILSLRILKTKVILLTNKSMEEGCY